MTRIRAIDRWSCVGSACVRRAARRPPIRPGACRRSTHRSCADGRAYDGEPGRRRRATCHVRLVPTRRWHGYHAGGQVGHHGRRHRLRQRHAIADRLHPWQRRLRPQVSTGYRCRTSTARCELRRLRRLQRAMGRQLVIGSRRTTAARSTVDALDRSTPILTDDAHGARDAPLFLHRYRRQPRRRAHHGSATARARAGVVIDRFCLMRSSVRGRPGDIVRSATVS